MHRRIGTPCGTILGAARDGAGAPRANERSGHGGATRVTAARC
jgi:hypothetical protein